MGEPSRTDEHQQEVARIIRITEERNEFLHLEDGYVYFWPEGSPHGALSSWMLRALADELDLRNAAWDEEIRRYLETHPQPVNTDLELEPPVTPRRYQCCPVCQVELPVRKDGKLPQHSPHRPGVPALRNGVAERCAGSEHPIGVVTPT